MFSPVKTGRGFCCMSDAGRYMQGIFKGLHYPGRAKAALSVNMGASHYPGLPDAALKRRGEGEEDGTGRKLSLQGLRNSHPGAVHVVEV